MDISGAEKLRIEELRKKIQFRGTPEKGYTDSGLWLFLDCVYTKDSHEKKQPVKKLPVADKDFLKILFLHLLACEKFACPKSRQMMVSWAMCAYDVWHAMSAPYRHVVYQTKKEGDAHEMVTEGRKNPASGRMDFILQYLPDWLKDENIDGGNGNLVGKLVFDTNTVSDSGLGVPWYGSKIEAVPGGADQVRGKTPSKVSIDEAAFHDELNKVIVACNPAVAGGGQLSVFSSVDAGSDFNAIVLDHEMGAAAPHESHPVVQKGMDLIGLRWPRGMRSWQTRSGFWCLELHYTADPEKDPDRDGLKWYTESIKGYRGGVQGKGWRTEMEIDYEAGGGEKMFPYLADPMSPVFVDHIDPEWAMQRMNVFAGYDYGTNNPSAFIVWGIDEQGRAYALWELYEPCVNLKQHANRIKKCPYFDKLEFIAADNKIFSKTQQGANGIKSIAQLFHEEQIPMSPARQGVDYPVAIRFHSEYWADGPNGFKNEEPGAFITASCPNLKSEVRGLRLQEHRSDLVKSYKNNPEKLVDKKNHAWDASAYAHDRRPSQYRPNKESNYTGSIQEFIDRSGMNKTSTGLTRKRSGIVVSGSVN